MLPRKYKLSRTSFPGHADQKLPWSGKVLRIQAYRKTTAEGPRFAVIVPKRLSTSAVMRNAFKRQVMEVIERHLVRLKSLPYQKYIVTPREHLRAIAQGQIIEDIEQFLVQRESAQQ
jgi:ribonuclease P protein component